MRRQSSHGRRARIGFLGRATAWLVAVALLVECSVSAGAALGMWMQANGPSQMAQDHCAERAGGKPDQHSRHANHDHEHCLLCTAVVGDCPMPVLPLLSAALDESVVLVATPESVASRKVVHANAPRGPPALT